MIQIYKLSKFNNVLTINDGIYFYNSFTKACIKIKSKKEIEDFVHYLNNNLEKSQKHHRIFKILKSNGFIINKEVNEIDSLDYVYKKRYFDSTVANIILVPTLKCNFNCSYCFEKNNDSIEEKKDYFVALTKYTESIIQSHSKIHISLFGGEPLIKHHEIFQYLELVKQETQKHSVKFSTSITTNGSLVSKNILEKLLKFNCTHLQITLDGGEENHNKYRCFKDGNGSFKLLLDKINLIAERVSGNKMFKQIVRINLNNTSLEEVESTLSKIKETYRKNIIILFRPIYNTDNYSEDNSNSDTQLLLFYKLAVKMGFKILKNEHYYSSCEACGDINTFYIVPDLSVWKCINDLNYEAACMGKISENGKLDLKVENVVNWYKAASWINDQECRDCSLVADCLGGCILFNRKNNKRNCSQYERVSLPYFYKEVTS